MTSTAVPTVSTGSSSGRDNVVDFNRWTALNPKSVVAADELAPDVVASMWAKMYNAAGYGNASEDKKEAFRCWVYVTGALNGTSRQGDYNSSGYLADGTKVDDAIIIRACGDRIRKFYRSNMAESYRYFKNSKVMENYPRFVSKAASLKIGVSEAFAMADWLDNCPMFTPLESRAHDRSFEVGVTRARRARGGKNLEVVEGEAVAAKNRVNGPFVDESEGGQTYLDF